MGFVTEFLVLNTIQLELQIIFIRFVKIIHDVMDDLEF